MKSYLKTRKIRVEEIGEEIEIRELSARAQIELIELHRSGKAESSGGLVCKHGVVGWEAESVEEIEAALPAKAVAEIARAIYELSGVDLAKNSDSAPSEGSSSD